MKHIEEIVSEIFFQKQANNRDTNEKGYKGRQ